MKTRVLIFIYSFIFNLVWENLHSLLYTSYQGQSISEWILIRASFWDAVLLSILFAIFKKSSHIVSAGIAIAIAIELFAQMTNRWAYNEYMPMIPILNIGLSPVLQLALIGYIIFRMKEKRMI